MMVSATTAQRGISPEVGTGHRRSLRERKKPGSLSSTTATKIRRPSQKVEIERSDTLKDIRIKIDDLVDMPVLYQRIFYRGREIEDPAENVDSIGISAEETLFVLELPSHDDNVDISTLIDVPHPQPSRNGKPSKTPNGRVEGFGGTVLHGNNGLGYSIDEDDQAANIAAALPGLCPQCTFQNDRLAKKCEICDTDL